MELTMPTPTYTEKRNFIRMRIDTPITLIYGDPEKKVRGICRDISGAGMLIETADTLPKGTTCKAVVYDKSKNAAKLEAVVCISRIGSSKSGDIILGVVIKEMLT